MKNFFSLFFFSVILNLFHHSIIAQQNKIDSLLQVLKIATADTSHLNILNEITIQYINTSNYKQALRSAQEALQTAEKLNYQKGIATAYSNIGLMYWYEGYYEGAFDNHLKALKIREEIGDKQGAAISYNNIGNVYDDQGNYEKAMINHLKALKIRQEIGDKTGVSASYNNIGNIYRNQNNYQKALDNYLKSFEIREEISLKTPNDIANKKGIGHVYNNMGLVYESQGDYKKSLSYHFKTLKIRQEMEDKQGIASSYNNIGSVYIKLSEFKDAYNYLNQGLIIYKEIGAKQGIKETYNSLAELYEKEGNYKQAYRNHILYLHAKDTLLNDQSSKRTAEMNTKYESEKKDKELAKKNAEIAQRQAETEKKKLQFNTFVIGFVLLLLLTFYIYKSYRQKQTANKILEEKNELIANQKQLVEEKNLKIINSITYARRIQQAIMPSQEILKHLLPNSFVFFKPKDIVSGDFYWIHAIDNYEILFAAVDCTGHGVPGALMSIMGYNLLEQVVKEHRIYEPAIILNELSKSIVELLKQNDDQQTIKDGMDIALCKINYQNYELEYAGAHNSLYLIRNGILTETKATRRSVGISLPKSDSFLNHKIKLERGDCLYIFSDGYADQKGGTEKEKFFYSSFRELLTAIHRFPVEEQEQQLEKKIVDWMGGKEQIDDILVIGIKI